MRKFLLMVCVSSLVFPLSSIAQKQQDAAFYKNLVEKNESVIGISHKNLQGYRITDAYLDKHTGFYMVYIQQTFKNVDVYGNISALIFKGDVWKAGKFINDNNIVTAKTLNEKPALNAAAAVKKAASDLGLQPGAAVIALEQKNEAREVLFGKLGISQNNIKANLFWLKDDNDNYHLSWQTQIHTAADNALWAINVDASTGVIISKKNLTAYDNYTQPVHQPRQILIQEDNANNSGSSYQQLITQNENAVNAAEYYVVPFPAESQITASGKPVTVTNPWEMFPNANATTLKWNTDDSTDYDITWGNNVHAKQDTLGKDKVIGSPAFSTTKLPNLTFNFIPDYTVSPHNSTNEQFAITNLFYWNNLMHDMSYQYGFDEVSGNFQQTNLGRGGKGNDFVFADAQDGSGTNNANFATPADGGNPRMQMFLWSAGLTSDILDVNKPEEFKGKKPAVESGFSTKNKLQNTGATTGNVALYNDGADTIHLGCDSPSNPGMLAGKIALIDRGSCSFSNKVFNAQNAGAIAAIVVDNIPGEAPIVMGGTNNKIIIPAIMVSYETGDTMKSYLGIDSALNVTMKAGIEIDGDLDNGVIAHEYTHGISNRLTGGPSQSSCLTNAEQMGEGISDYFALMITTDWAKAKVTDGNKIRAIGNYVVGRDSTGLGIRTYPYTTDISTNPWMYDSIGKLPRYLIFNQPEPHVLGEIWTTMLWEMTWSIIQQAGTINTNFADATLPGGNTAAMNLFMQGLKLQPCNPTFLEARDAILEADTLLYGGKYSPAIWMAFAKRGLGYSADQQKPNNWHDNISGYDVPSTLPVVFGDFTATRQGSASSLKWSTLQENNIDRFVVLRSSDGRNFIEIGAVKAAGNSTSKQAYSLVDNSPANGTNIYQIKEIDKDARFTLSDLRSLNFSDLKPYIKLSPNPARNIVTLTVPGNSQQLTVKLTSTAGQVLHTYFMSGENYQLNVASLAAGVYTISVSGENMMANYKLIIQ